MDERGRPKMVDVAEKPETVRTARAAGQIRMKPEAYSLIEGTRGPKGDVLAIAELAGVMGAKRTAELIPLCHPVGLDHVAVHAALDPALPGVRIESEVRAVGRTGVEMEALVAVAIGLLTVYDMVKSAGHGMEMGAIRLLEKRGGVRGDWNAKEESA